MNLIIRVSKALYQPLNKAGKQGLIAVQKQVTKKGKTFTQTFYVKPVKAPDAPNLKAPAPIEKLKPITVHYDGAEYDIESNRPEGGFFISSAIGGEAVRVPEQCMKATMQVDGFTYIIHQPFEISPESGERVWLDSYVATEASTGLKITQKAESVEDAMGKVVEITLLQKEKIPKLVANAKKITEHELVTLDTATDIIQKPIALIAPGDVDSMVEKILSVLDNGSVTDEQVRDWIMTKYNNTWDLGKLDKYLSDMHLHKILDLNIAVTKGFTLASAKKHSMAIADIMSAVSNSKSGADEYIPEEQVLAWAKKHHFSFINGFNLSDYKVEGGEPVEEMVAWAIMEDESLNSVMEQVMSDVEDAYSAAGMPKKPPVKKPSAWDLKDADEASIGSVSFKDSSNKKWSFSLLQDLGNWVSGGYTVRRARDLTKQIDGARRKSVSDDSEGYSSIFEMIEQNMAPATHDEIYRGTGNPSWEKAQVGQIVPLGVASFTTSGSKANGFAGSGGTVIVLNNSDKDVIGIDVTDVIKTGKSLGSVGMAAIDVTHVDRYKTEKEFIVRSPSIEILDIKDNVNFGDIMEGKSNDEGMYSSEKLVRVVYARVAEMDLVKFMKSLFEQDAKLIAAMESTFDYHIAQEPEEWN